MLIPLFLHSLVSSLSKCTHFFHEYILFSPSRPFLSFSPSFFLLFFNLKARQRQWPRNKRKWPVIYDGPTATLYARTIPRSSVLFIKRISYITISSITVRILWPSVALWPTRATPDVCAAFTDDTRGGKSLKTLRCFLIRLRTRSIRKDWCFALEIIYLYIMGLSTMFVLLILENDFIILRNRKLIMLKLNRRKRSFQVNFLSSISLNFINLIDLFYLYFFFFKILNYSCSIFLQNVFNFIRVGFIKNYWEGTRKRIKS